MTVSGSDLQSRGDGDDRWQVDLAHEICGATHAILGYASLLDTTTTSANDQRMLAGISRAARRITSIIEALAAAERPGSDPVELVDLSSLVNALHHDHKGGVGAAWADLPTVLPDLPLVLAEPTRLRNVLALIGDELIARSPGECRVDASVEEGTVSLRFTTQGAVPSAIALQLLSTLADHCGVGLRVQEGDSTAVISLRFARAHGDASGMANEEPAATALTILHVDDDDSARALVEAILCPPRYEVVSVASLDAARRALARSNPDVLLVDHRLGEETGIELVAEVRTGSLGTDQMVVMVMSAERSEELQAQAESLGATVLTKPIPPTQLLEAIERAATGPMTRS